MTAALRETKEEAGLSKVKRGATDIVSVSVGGPDPQDPHVFLGLPNPDPLVRCTNRDHKGVERTEIMLAKKF
jgi:hypothetical protein